MDRANYELAWYLADHLGAAVHLVSHRVVSPLAEHPRVTWHRVAKPMQSYALAGPLLARGGYRIARQFAATGARVIVNGGNCPWADVNWVHAVHAAWPNRDREAPAFFRLRNRWFKYRARRAERRAVRRARLVVTNSRRTRQDVIDRLGVAADRVQVVYLGVDAGIYKSCDLRERAAIRNRLGLAQNRPIVLFVGSLGRDRNKGFDVLFTAWQQLCKEPDWNADLMAAGRGSEVELWRHRVAAAGLSERVRFLGFTRQVPELLSACDALVSPTHYDAYGLSVHEALCCGLPAFVTRTAGVAERYPSELADLLLNDPPDPIDLAARLRRWFRDRGGYQARVAPFGEMLRQRTWTDMAAEMADLMEDAA
jgi:glycosyltransferase involved in cell wall biosynthesis